VKVGSTTPGISVHRGPTVIVEQRTSSDLTGATIAHEFGHVWTLEHPTETATPDDNTPGNIMNPSNAGRDDFVNSGDADKGLENVNFTDAQRARIAADGVATAMGVQGTMESPGHLRPFQHGSVTDDLGDVAGGGPAYADLNWITLDSEVGEEFIRALITLNDLFPASGPVDITYTLLFDVDADSFSGFAIGSFSGIDREVTIRVVGDASLAPLTVAAVMLDASTFENLLIPQPTLLVGTEETGLDAPPVPHQHQIEIFIPKTELGMTATQVPVGVAARNAPVFFQAFTELDTAALTFDRAASESFPTLTLFTEFAAPGDSIPFDIAGLTPNADFDLFVNDTPVLTNTLNSSGEFSGSFAFPSVPAGFHFLTAQDTTGAFAFNALVFLSPGQVPASMTVEPSTTTPGDLTITWSPSCSPAGTDYAIHEGAIGSWYSHTQVSCSDIGSDLTEEVTPTAGDRYYLVVPLNPDDEGSYGINSGGAERPVGSARCVATQAVGPCP
jgi:hypothetical protein